MFDRARRHLLRVALGAGGLAMLAGFTGSLDVAAVLGLISVALLLVDEKLKTNTWTPWGDD
ncbi:hypothetical protein ACFQJC_04870 [Haloferax namakaokahaiae]|uniref:DUF2892 domain-containing protein n=1 Tax=Haloferax namakaokahaiae TaxID=1748331 RepID=A0ABD5ZC30_9EURY